MYLDLYWTVKFDGFCSSQRDGFFLFKSKQVFVVHI